MSRMFQYYGRLNDVRGNLFGLPAWARLILVIAALPGIVLLALSAAVFLASLFALLLLAVPTYRLLRAVVGPGGSDMQVETSAAQQVNPADLFGGMFDPSAGRRHVDVKVIEPTSEPHIGADSQA